MAKNTYITKCALGLGKPGSPLVPPGSEVELNQDAETKRLLALGAIVEAGAVADEPIPAGGSVTSETGANISHPPAGLESIADTGLAGGDTEV